MDSKHLSDPPTKAQSAKKRIRVEHVRGIVFGAIFIIIAISLIFHTGTGTPSAFGIGWIAGVCPLGILETMATGRNLGAHALILLAIAVVLTLLFGKAFCSWVCPSSYIRRLFGVRGQKRAKEAAAGQGAAGSASATSASTVQTGADANRKASGEQAVVREDAQGAAVGQAVAGKAGEDRAQAGSAKRPKSPYVVLIGVLASSLICGFPVFCLVCPVGLTFATFIALWHLFEFSEVTLSLIVFPAIVLLELVFFKKWCSAICPLGALLSLVSRGNRTVKPRVDTSACLRENGHECSRCENACPESIDPHERLIPDCTKCGKCVDVCPAQAISFKLLDLAAKPKDER